MTASSENSGFIEGFLRKVGSGRDFSQDIWIERAVKRQGEGGEVTKANSSSQKVIGKQIHTLTDLLQDDLDYCFNKGRFVFRFIPAITGSGKTTLLSYFKELIEVSKDYSRYAIVISFELSAKLRASKSFEDFQGKFYSYIIAETIWNILRNVEIEIVGECILQELVEADSFNQLTQARDSKIVFLRRFNDFIKNADVDLQDVFLGIISRVSNHNPQYAFVYLVDELDDALREDNTQFQMRAVLKSLTNKLSSQEYNDEVRLLIYMAGTSDILSSFINSESASRRRFSNLSITLGSGTTNEFQQIREKINRRIEGAYKNCDGFDEAFHKVQKIDEELKPKLYGNMRILGDYCREYALAVLEIYEEHFSNKSENHFEGSLKQLRDLIDTICRSHWKDYLDKPEYRLILEKVPDNPDKHIFTHYAKLLRDEESVAIAYGGARNYELLSGYVDKFIQLLDESNFKSDSHIDAPPDIAFILSPVKCSFLLENKLKLKKIHLVNLSETTIDTLDTLSSRSSSDSTQEVVAKNKIPVDINMANENTLVSVFNDTNIHKNIIAQIVVFRPYRDMEDLIDKVQGIGVKRRATIREKIDRNEICFRYGVFISYNTQDKTEVDKIVRKLKENKISYWIDDKILAGEEIRKKLEEIIKSDQLWAAVIFYGKNGPGPWQDAEISSLLRKHVKHEDLIIPAVLGSCIETPQISPFLENFKYVDFRNKKPDPIEFLVRSIKREQM